MKNAIWTLQNLIGNWIYGRQYIGKHVIAYIQDIFQIINHQHFQSLDNLFQPCIIDYENTELCIILESRDRETIIILL